MHIFLYFTRNIEEKGKKDGKKEGNKNTKFHAPVKRRFQPNFRSIFIFRSHKDVPEKPKVA